MSSSTVHAVIMAENAIPHTGDSNLSFPALTCHVQPSNLTCLVGSHRTQLRAYLLMLAGISKPQQGHVNVFGQNICKLEQSAWQKFRCQVGYLSGSSPLLSEQHALMNVMLPALYHLNLPFHQAAGKARALLTELNCQFESTTYPALLNSFQRTQVALARALMLDPALLILDVPFNDLGAKEREQIAILLGKYKQNRSICMIGGLQYPRFLEQYAEQIIFISEHKIMKFNGWKQFVQTKDQDVQTLLSIL